MSKSSTALQTSGFSPFAAVVGRLWRVFAADPAEIVARQAPIVVIPAEDRAFTIETLDVATLVEQALADVERASAYVRSERAQEHLGSASDRLRRIVDFLNN